MKDRECIIDEVMTKGQIDFNGLRELANDFAEKDAYCKKTGTTITDTQINAFLCTMDLDGNHVLDQDEVVGILTKKKDIGGGTMMMGVKGKGKK